jgi:Rps23 Pro-64 3,4-dihydroxylase Tpa1-like proline 4-hydroxylase
MWLRAGGGQPWGATGRLPGPGQYCFEALQVAVYQHGQYFMTHEVRLPELRYRTSFFPAAGLRAPSNHTEGGLSFPSRMPFLRTWCGKTGSSAA